MAEEVSMDMEKQLGEVICARNPYPKDREKAIMAIKAKNHGKANVQEGEEPITELVRDFESQIEEDSYQAGYWKFRDRSLHIAKAIRIPYIYIDENGNKVREYILIGYEGSGGE
jgi:hypothetical protein